MTQAEDEDIRKEPTPSTPPDESSGATTSEEPAATASAVEPKESMSPTETSDATTSASMTPVVDDAEAGSMPGTVVPPPMPPSITAAPGQAMPVAAPDLSRVNQEPSTPAVPEDDDDLTETTSTTSWQAPPVPPSMPQPSSPTPPSAAPTYPQSASAQWSPPPTQPAEAWQPSPPSAPSPQLQQPVAQWQQPIAPPAQPQWQQPGAPPSQWQPPTAPYAGQPAGPYPGQPGAYAGQPGPYPGQPGAYPGQPQYWAAGPAYSTSALVAVAGLVLLAFGLVDAIGGFWLLGQGGALQQLIGRIIRLDVFGLNIDQSTMRAILSPLPGILMVVGALQVVAAIGIFAHKGWGRALGIIFSIIGLLVGIAGVSLALAFAPGFSVPLLGAIVVVLGYAFVLLALLAGGGHFRRRQPQR